MPGKRRCHVHFDVKDDYKLRGPHEVTPYDSDVAIGFKGPKSFHRRLLQDAASGMACLADTKMMLLTEPASRDNNNTSADSYCWSSTSELGVKSECLVRNQPQYVRHPSPLLHSRDRQAGPAPMAKRTTEYVSRLAVSKRIYRTQSSKC